MKIENKPRRSGEVNRHDRTSLKVFCSEGRWDNILWWYAYVVCSLDFSLMLAKRKLSIISRRNEKTNENVIPGIKRMRSWESENYLFFAFYFWVEHKSLNFVWAWQPREDSIPRKRLWLRLKSISINFDSWNCDLLPSLRQKLWTFAWLIFWKILLFF